MFRFMTNRPIYFNKSLSDYCTRTTNESMRKLTENKPIIKYTLENADDPKKPEVNFYHFIMFLSISYFTYFFYKRIE